AERRGRRTRHASKRHFPDRAASGRVLPATARHVQCWRAAKALKLHKRKPAAFSCEADSIPNICERIPATTPREYLMQRKVAQSRFGRQHPLHHLRVGGRRKIGAPERNMGGDVFAGRGYLQPRCVFVQRLEKSLQPAVLIAMRERSRPHAKLFHVVAEGGRAAGTRLGGFLEIGDGFLDQTEWNEVTQFLESREKPDGLATILGNVRAIELFGFEA